MRIPSLAFALLCVAVPAVAASDEDWRACESDDPIISAAGCTRIIEAEPNAKETNLAYNNRGLAASRRHDSAAALTDYTRAIALNPGNDFALHNRAMIYDDRGQYDLAIADFNKAVAANPIGGHFYNRGRVYYHAGRFREAADDFTVALQLWPAGNVSAVVLAARCRAIAARGMALADARADCDNAVTADPKNTVLLIARAMVRFRQGDFAGVIDDTTRALAMPPLDPHEELPLLDIGAADAYFLRGLAELRQGRDAAGRQDIAATAHDPGLAARYAKVGISQ